MKTLWIAVHMKTGKVMAGVTDGERYRVYYPVSTASKVRVFVFAMTRCRMTSESVSSGIAYLTYKVGKTA